MKAIQVTTAFARHDDEHDFDDIEELVDVTGYELDDESNVEELLEFAKDEEHPPFVYEDPHAGALRWARKRAKAVDAITDEGDDADDDGDNVSDDD
jgi:hypothetical protein